MSISINGPELSDKIQSMNNTIQQDIINEALAFQTYVDGTLNSSAGEFAEMMKKYGKHANEIVSEIGELLIATLDYIDAARASFAQVDLSYSSNKIDS